MSLKIAVYYDSLWIKGGAERVAAELANAFDADLITSGLNPVLKEWLNVKGECIDIGNTLITKSKDLGVLVESPARFATFKPTKKYDIHLFLGFNSIYAARPGNNNVWFCFTPNRMLYDNKEMKATTGSLAKQLFFKTYQSILTPLDQKAVKNMTAIVAQTETVKERIKRFYNKDSEVIYSPLTVSHYFFKKYGEFFLAVGRLVPEKRMSLIAETFASLPDHRLVVVGDGPEKNRIEELSKSNPNIEFICDASEQTLLDLYANCLATIYLPQNEDYGLVPLESMSSGKVCIAANEGGCRETVSHGVTGLLIKPDKETLQKTIKSFDKTWAKKQKNVCIEAAKKFDIAVCIKQWKKLFKHLGKDEN